MVTLSFSLTLLPVGIPFSTINSPVVTSFKVIVVNLTSFPELALPTSSVWAFTHPNPLPPPPAGTMIVKHIKRAISMAIMRLPVSLKRFLVSIVSPLSH